MNVLNMPLDVVTNPVQIRICLMEYFMLKKHQLWIFDRWLSCTYWSSELTPCGWLSMPGESGSSSSKVVIKLTFLQVEGNPKSSNSVPNKCSVGFQIPRTLFSADKSCQIHYKLIFLKLYSIGFYLYNMYVFHTVWPKKTGLSK